MTGWQLDAGGLYVPKDAPDGPYLPRKTGTRFDAFVRLVDGATTTVEEDLITGDVSIEVASSETDYVVTVINGVPSSVFDDDSTPVTTEVPS